MKVKNISYPYPVLGNEDDIIGKIDVSFSHVLGNEKIVLKVGFDLKNKVLEELVEKGKAVFSVEVECSSTFYRSSFLTGNYDNSFEIDSPKCRDRVVVKFYIRANQQLENYSNPDCNKDYVGLSFDLGKGDILAVGGQSSFIAEKDFDPLRPIVSAFIAVQEGDQDQGIIVDFWDNNRILIKLTRKDWSKYQALKGRLWISPIIHSSIVFPVLAEAIRLVGVDADDIEGTRWCSRLKTIMEQKNLDCDHPFDSAQVILQYPLAHSLSNIESQQFSGEEED